MKKNGPKVSGGTNKGEMNKCSERNTGPCYHQCTDATVAEADKELGRLDQIWLFNMIILFT